MRVFIVGATGVYGRALIPRLVERGDTVVAMARSMERAEAIAGPGVDVVLGDLLSEPPDSLAHMMEGCDAAMHLATALRPGVHEPGAHGALRTEGTPRLLDAVTRAGVRRYIQQSITMAYPDSGDAWLDESTPIDESEAAARMAAPVIAMEAMLRALDPAQVAWTILRGGLFVGPETTQEAVIEGLRAGTEKITGDGNNWLSLVHVEDMAAATVLALDRAPAGSTFNINDEPIRNGEYLERLAELVGAPPPARDPDAPRARSFRCSSDAARRILEWAPEVGIWPDPARWR